MKRLLLLFPLLFLVIISSGFDTPPPRQIIPSNLEIGKALKQALEQGTTKSTAQLSAVDGFFGNAAVKILFPPQAQKAERTLRSLGLNQLCDNVILSLNRAAEDAAKQATPIFINAIKHMTLDDVSNILLGSQDAATQYFKQTTTADLAASFRPVIQVSLDKVGATKYYADAAKAYNKVPFVSKINPDLVDYATQKAIDGIFVQIAVEELNIRQNLHARPTALLQKVFSFADKNKKF
ncbi:MAG: DUF4197 domain-containing protein [Mucilaginibacter sp.]